MCCTYCVLQSNVCLFHIMYALEHQSLLQDMRRHNYTCLYSCIFTSLSTLSTLCQSSRWIWPLALFCFSALSQASPGCAMCGYQSSWWFVIIMNCDQWGAGLIKGDVWQHGKACHRGTLSIHLVSGNIITIDIISIDNVNLPSSPLTSSPLISFKYHWHLWHWHLCHWHNHLYRGGGKKELLAWTPCRQPWRQPWRTLGLECRLSNWFFDFIDDVVMQEYWESRGTEADPWHECGSTEVNIAWIWSGYGHPKIYNMLHVTKTPYSFSPDDAYVVFWMVWEQLHKASWALKL